MTQRTGEKCQVTRGGGGMDKWDQGDKVQRGGQRVINHTDLGRLSETEMPGEAFSKTPEMATKVGLPHKC